MSHAFGKRLRLWPSLLGVVALLLGGCAAMPTSGPTSRQIELGERIGAPDSYVLLDLNQEIVAALNSDSSLGLSRRLLPTRIKDSQPRIGVGDVQQVVEIAIGETVLTTTIEGRARFPVRVRYRSEDRADPRSPSGAEAFCGVGHADRLCFARR